MQCKGATVTADRTFSLPRRRTLRGLIGGALAVAASLAIASSTFAASNIAPTSGSATSKAGSYFVIPATPGQAVVQSLTISNSGPASVTYDLTAVDAITGTGGGVVFMLETDPVTSSGAWLTLSAATIDVLAGQSKVVPFTVKVPADATPGNHVAGISISERTAGATARPLASGDVSVGVTIRSRRVLAVQVDVAGTATPSLAGVSAGAGIRPTGVYAEVTLKNSGQVFLHPTGTVTLSDPSGKALFDTTFKLDTFVPGTTTVVAVPWSQALPAAGTYPVHVAGTDATGASLAWDGQIVIDAAVASAAADRVAFPSGAAAPVPADQAPTGTPAWFLVFGIVLGLAAVSVVLVFVMRGRRREGQLLATLAAERAEDRARTEELLRQLGRDDREG